MSDGVDDIARSPPENLVGVGLYTPSEAGRPTEVRPSRITRRLQGHEREGMTYAPLWRPQIDAAGAGLVLGFRDLQEVRVADAFIKRALSPQRVRQAIDLARDLIGEERPLSTRRFRTDGRSVFLQIVEADGGTTLIDLFHRQYAFGAIVEKSLAHLDYDDGLPARWWPLGRRRSIVLDPARSFGQPIEAETSVPTTTLASAATATAEGSAEATARAWDVPVRAIRRAVAFERVMAERGTAERKAA